MVNRLFRRRVNSPRHQGDPHITNPAFWTLPFAFPLLSRLQYFDQVETKNTPSYEEGGSGGGGEDNDGGKGKGLRTDNEGEAKEVGGKAFDEGEHQ